MTKLQEEIAKTIQELVDINHPRLVIRTSNQRTSVLIPMERMPNGYFVKLVLSLDDTEENYETLTDALAKTFSALDNLSAIKNHECSHPDFYTRVENILLWRILTSSYSND